MARITVLGGTGYTGGNIVRAAAARGHTVVSVSRTEPDTPVDGVTYETGSLLDDTTRQRAIDGADVVVAALAPRGALENELRGIYRRLSELVAGSSARLVVIGGFSSLRPELGAPRMAYGDDLPPQFAAEGRAMAQIADDLADASPEGLDWLYVSPAAGYGSYVPGEATGNYRLGNDVAFFDEQGESAISGADFATAVLDEIDKPSRHRAHVSVAY